MSGAQSISAASVLTPQAWGVESTTMVTPEERLLALVVHTKLTQMESAKESVDASFEQLTKLREQVREAMDKAKEAQRHSGFFGAIAGVLNGDIGAIAGLLAATAAAILSGGTALAVLAVVASAVSLAAQHAEELGIPPEVAMGIGIIAAGAALCCGNTSGLLQVSESLKKAANTVKLVASVTAGAANMGGGVASVAKGAYERTAANAQADARWAGGQQDLTNLDIDDAIQLMSKALDQRQAAIDTISDGAANRSSSVDRVLTTFAGAA
jgi:hypothetical protein